MKNMYNEYPERIYVDRGIDASTAALLNKTNSSNDFGLTLYASGLFKSINISPYFYCLDNKLNAFLINSSTETSVFAIFSKAFSTSLLLYPNI